MVLLHHAVTRVHIDIRHRHRAGYRGRHPPQSGRARAFGGVREGPGPLGIIEEKVRKGREKEKWKERGKKKREKKGEKTWQKNCNPLDFGLSKRQ